MGRRPRFKTPMSQARDKLVGFTIRPFMLFQPRTRYLIGFVILVVLTTLLVLTNYTSGYPTHYKEGDIVTRAIIARADITTVDLTETERRKNAARALTRPVFNFDSSRSETSAQSFRAAWDELKKQAANSDHKNATWTGDGGPGVAKAIVAHNFNEADLDRLTAIIREVGNTYIYDDSDGDRLQQEIVLVDVRNQSLR